MSLPWFRLYAEFANDAKVQSMAEVMQRRLVMLMCLRCGDVTVTLCDDELAFHLRISDAELAETKVLFMRKRFVDSKWNLLNWDKRQCASDSSAARTRAYRKRQRDVTVTANVTERDAIDKIRGDIDKKDQEQERMSDKPLAVTRSKSRFDEFWTAYPVKKGRSAAEAKWKARKLDAIADVILADVARRQTQDRDWLDGYIPHGSTYVNGKGWEDGMKTVSNLARTAPPAPMGKTAQAIQALEDMKHGNRLDSRRDFDRLAEAPAALAGKHPGE